MDKSIVKKLTKNHFIPMVICCAVPLILIIALGLTGLLESWGYYILILLCPLLHIFMMLGHSSSHDNMDNKVGIGKRALKDRFEEE